MNWLDKSIALISPRVGWERAMYRAAMDPYDAGANAHNNYNWSPPSDNAENLNTANREMLRNRARDLERNSDVAKSLLSAFKRNVVGTGIKLSSKAKGGRDKKIEELWLDFCKKENCEVTGTYSFNTLQRTCLERTIVDGGILILKVYNNNSKYGFQLQLCEVDDFAETTFCGSENRVIHGVELDQYNKAVAYHLKKRDVNGYDMGETVRLPADQVIFLFTKNRPSQIREVSELAPTLEKIRDIDQYTEAVAVKERVNACLSVFIKKNGISNTVGRGIAGGHETEGQPIQRLSPGTISYLRAGEDAQVINPSGQASNASEFVAMHERMIGSGQGLSYETISRDMSKSNYSSARQGMLEDQQTYQIWQEFLITYLCEDVYHEFVRACYLKGFLAQEDYMKNKEEYCKCQWIASGFAWIDPLKEVRANQMAMESGQKTLRDICAENGMDWRDVANQRVAERAYIQQLEKEIQA